jgi:hypothetical protein
MPVFMSRFYDPETGRYISADPIGLAGGMNLYAYVENDPVNFVDPLGLFYTKPLEILMKDAILSGLKSAFEGEIADRMSQDDEMANGARLEFKFLSESESIRLNSCLQECANQKLSKEKTCGNDADNCINDCFITYRTKMNEINKLYLTRHRR